MMQNKIKVLALALLCFTASHAQTQLTDWVNLNSKSTVTSITHDADHLYISSMGGGIVQINKHTGEQRCIDHAQDNLPDIYVLSVAVHDHELWATNRFYGISQHTAKGWLNHTSTTTGFYTNQWFSSLAFDGNTTWIGGLMALYEMRSGQVVNTYNINPFSDYCIVSDIAIDRQHQVWLACSDYRRQFALSLLDTAEGEVVNVCNTYGDANALAVDADNSLWVATEQGLLHYTAQSQTIYNSSNTPLLEDVVVDVQIDEQSNIWFLTRHYLYRYDRSTFTTYPLPYMDDIFRCLDIDGTNVYVGTHQHGLLSLTNSTLVPIAFTIPSAPTSSMRSGAVDSNGRFWTGYANGVIIYDPAGTATTTIPMRQVDEVVADNQGGVWIKTFNVGDTCLLRITPADTTAYLCTQYPFANNYICQMCIDRRNRLWLATTHGLFCLDNEQWTAYTTANSDLPSDYIYSIDIDSKNRVWCGTFGKGLICFDGVHCTTYTTAQGLASDYIAAVCIDKNDVVWMNCRNSEYPEMYGLGLFALYNEQITAYTATSSLLASNTIWDIQADGLNNLWIATSEDKGVTQFDGTHWQIHNTTNSGLALNEATHIAIDEKNHRIWFTCYAGGGVSYAQLQYDNTAVPTVDANHRLNMSNKQLLFVTPTAVAVYDTAGRLAHAEYGTRIDLSALQRGIYIVHVTSTQSSFAAPVFLP